MYHQNIMVNEDSTLRVSANCYDILRCRKMSVIILPPLMDKYLNTLTYTSLPPWKPDCHPNEITWRIQYPMDHAILILNAQHELPVEIAGGKGHTLYWHLDDQFVQRSEDETSFMLHPDEGEHVLTIMDENGLMMKRRFVVR